MHNLKLVLSLGKEDKRKRENMIRLMEVLTYFELNKNSKLLCEKVTEML